MGNEHDDDVTPLEIPAVRPGCDISRRNARVWVQRASIAELAQWKPCGCDGCVFCDEAALAKNARMSAHVHRFDRWGAKVGPAEPLVCECGAEQPTPPPADHGKIATTDGRPADEVRAEQHAAPSQGQHRSYLVLSEDERRRGFVRAVRQSYKHVGIPGPRYPLRDMTDEERAKHPGCNYVKFEAYPESMSPVAGMYWTQAKLDAIGKGCGTVTTMGRAIAETYARSPTFYGATYCAGCGCHLPVGEHGEFVWVDLGRETTERVGT